MSNRNKVINGRTFVFSYIPPTRAIVVEVELAKVLGSALFELLSTRKTNDSDELKKLGSVAIGAMLAQVDGDRMTALITTVMEFVSVGDGTNPARAVVLDADFIGKPKEMWQVFVAALQFNFADFLPESLFASVRAAMQASSSSSQPT